jgi:hypothetical protein
MEERTTTQTVKMGTKLLIRLKTFAVENNQSQQDVILAALVTYLDNAASKSASLRGKK